MRGVVGRDKLGSWKDGSWISGVVGSWMSGVVGRDKLGRSKDGS